MLQSIGSQSVGHDSDCAMRDGQRNRELRNRETDWAKKHRDVEIEREIGKQLGGRGGNKGKRREGGGQFGRRGMHGGLGHPRQSLPTWECCGGSTDPNNPRRPRRGQWEEGWGQEEGQA